MTTAAAGVAILIGQLRAVAEALESTRPFPLCVVTLADLITSLEAQAAGRLEARLKC